MSDSDSPIWRDPHGPACQRREPPTGPPLDYAGEKLQHGLEAQQSTARAVMALVHEDLDVDDPGRPGHALRVREELIRDIHLAFQYQLTGFPALYNMLGSMDGHDTVDRLLAMSPGDFDRWLSVIVREGLVTGL